VLYIQYPELSGTPDSQSSRAIDTVLYYTVLHASCHPCRKGAAAYRRASALRSHSDEEQEHNRRLLPIMPRRPVARIGFVSCALACSRPCPGNPIERPGLHMFSVFFVVRVMRCRDIVLRIRFSPDGGRRSPRRDISQNVTVMSYIGDTFDTAWMIRKSFLSGYVSTSLRARPFPVRLIIILGSLLFV
jgi:hypothetical protein